jgi:hypothetical protein
MNNYTVKVEQKKRNTDRHMKRYTNRLTNRNTYIQTIINTERNIDIEKNRNTESDTDNTQLTWVSFLIEMLSAVE